MFRPISTITAFVLLVIIIGACNNSENRGPVKGMQQRDWRYFGQEYPASQPVLFSPGIISTPKNERDFAISPSGNEIFYSRVMPGNNLSVIVHLKHDGAFWSQAEVASFSGMHSDLEPVFSPDGNTLFFVSKRPVSPDDTTDDWNIWFVEKAGRNWSAPKDVGIPVNTEGDEYYPSVASNGNLYFTASRKDSLFGGEDIYYSEFIDDKYQEPRNLGEAINSSLFEFNAFVSADEKFLIFSSFGREDGLGGGDLYVSLKDPDGNWLNAKNLGSVINSDKLDYCPFISYDNKYLFFTSQRTDPSTASHQKKNLNTINRLEDAIENGFGNIYWVEFDLKKYN